MRAALLLTAALCSPAAALTVAGFDGRAAAPVRAEAPAVPAPEAPAAPGFCIFDGAGKPEGARALETAAARGGLVAVGETHDQLNDHLAQLEALKALYAARGEKVAVGFEMLNLTLQPVLDDYAAGRLTEEEFKAGVNWQKEWGFDFNLYKPLFDFIREHKLRALALNLPKKIVSKIAMSGLAALTPEESAYLPAGMQVNSDERYVAYVRQSFQGHMSDMFKFENYLAAMSAWNETMGARLADFLRANPDHAALAVAGTGHVVYNAAITASFSARLPGVPTATFYTQGADACPAAPAAEDAGLADHVWYVAHTAAD